MYDLRIVFGAKKLYIIISVASILFYDNYVSLTCKIKEHLGSTHMTWWAPCTAVVKLNSTPVIRSKNLVDFSFKVKPQFAPIVVYKYIRFNDKKRRYITATWWHENAI